MSVIAERDPLLITDLLRTSYLSDAALNQRIVRGIAEEGSSMAVIYAPATSWKADGNHLEITIGASAVPNFKALLVGRLRHGRDATLQGDSMAVHFRPADAAQWAHMNEASVSIGLGRSIVETLAQQIEAKASVYKISEGIELHVVPSEIKDRDGKVVQIIG